LNYITAPDHMENYPIAGGILIQPVAKGNKSKRGRKKKGLSQGGLMEEKKNSREYRQGGVPDAFHKKKRKRTRGENNF